jgi:hypothetical protein
MAWTADSQPSDEENAMRAELRRRGVLPPAGQATEPTPEIMISCERCKGMIPDAIAMHNDAEEILCAGCYPLREKELDIEEERSGTIAERNRCSLCQGTGIVPGEHRVSDLYEDDGPEGQGQKG